MKKAALLLCLLMVCSMTACGSQKQEAENGKTLPADVSVTDENTESAETENILEPAEFFENKDSQKLAEESESSNILIVYFSRYGNTEYPDDVDATTSASIVADGNKQYGTTEYAADLIRKITDGDMHLIETSDPYTADFDELRDVNHREMEQDILPKLKKSSLDLTAYDTVFIGYPVWATSVPQAVLSFLEQYDLSGKTVIPFCTHDGYGAGRSYQVIEEASHAEVCLDGIAIEAEDVPDSHETIAAWLADIGISSPKEQTETAIQITAGSITLDAVLYNTALAEEIKEYFPLTVSMTGYGGREYYGGVEFYPNNLKGGQRNFENGDITYCEAHHNMAVFYAQTENPDLSVDVIPIGKVTSDLSVFESLGSREEFTFSLKQ